MVVATYSKINLFMYIYVYTSCIENEYIIGAKKLAPTKAGILLG